MSQNDGISLLSSTKICHLVFLSDYNPRPLVPLNCHRQYLIHMFMDCVKLAAWIGYSGISNFRCSLNNQINLVYGSSVQYSFGNFVESKGI